MGFKGLGILLAAVTASVVASCRTGGKDSHIVASEVVIAESPAPDSVFLYTPGIVEGFEARLVVSVDYGGPGTSVLDGSRSDFGDYKSGNQIRILLSDDEGKTWRETSARIPMMHEILFKAGKSLYMIGHSGRLLITRSDDNGETWSEPSVLCPEPRWHQSCAPVDIHDGKITLVYEKWVSDGHPWPGVGPVLLQAKVDDDLTEASSWKFSDLYNPDEDMEASRPSGIPLTDPGKAGILETNVIRVYDEKNPFYDSSGKSVVLMMRASVGIPDIGVMMRGVEKPDGSLAVEKLTKNGREMYFAHIPGADLKFYVVYDPESRLYWLLHSQMDGRMNYRRRLALSYSPDLLKWTFAGLVAVGPADNAARHYASMIIHGDDLLIVSRSGDERARNSHDGNLVTFHRVKIFRSLIY